MLKIYESKNSEEDKILRKISEEVPVEEIFSAKIQDKIKEMVDFVKIQPDGAALSAPQVGINLRFFIISKHVFASLKKDVSYEDRIFINPRIIKQSKKTEYMEEGCFSVRWYYGEVKRFKNVTIEAYNLKGEKKVWNTGGFLSQIFQHEIDHLDGILFTDKAKEIKKMTNEEIDKIKDLGKKMVEKIKKDSC